jgi:NB-ARC domain/TIR domain/APAF-1 helical domain
MDISVSNTGRQKRIAVVCCYAHEDEKLLKKLKGHLSPLQHQGLITIWYDRHIRAGAVWEKESNQRLNEADIILLLISPDFMNSHYCYGIEMQCALERHKDGEATIIPVILRPTYWHEGPLGALQALPADGRPVTSQTWGSQDEAFYAIVLGIRSAIEAYISKEQVLERQHSETTTSVQVTPARSVPGVMIGGNGQEEKVTIPQQVTVAENVYTGTETIYLPSGSVSTTLTPQEILHTRHRYDCYQQITLPTNYLERAGVLAEIRAVLLANAPIVALTSAIKGKPTALHGMGGIGKSVIARALCDDLAVREAFPDGILWATLGQTPNLPSQLRLWIEALGGKMRTNVSTVESLKRTLAELLKERTCLLILDDVWQHTHANVFRVDAPHCHLLLTTRDAEIARELGAQIRPISVMTPDDAIVLLEDWAEGHLAETSQELKAQIVRRLGYLPLAVKLAGAQLQWKAPEDWLRTFDVYELESLRPEDLHASLVKTFLLSLDALDKSPLNQHMRQLYLALAVFKEDEATPQAAIAKLWLGLTGLNANATDHLLHDLASRALLDFKPYGSSRAAHLHDLMRDLIRTELGEGGRLSAHQALLGAYRATCTGDGWHTAPDDGYLYAHLAYHLETAGYEEELKKLFANQRWMEVRVQQCDYTYDGYLADLTLALDHTTEDARKQINANQEPSKFVDCVRYTLIRTSINSLASNYIPELVAQAVAEGLWTPERALSVAAKMLDPIRRIETYVALLKTGCLNAHQMTQAQDSGLATVLSLEETARRVDTALAALAPLLTGPQALTTILALKMDWWLPEALAILVPLLTGSLLQQALGIVLTIEEDQDGRRVKALAALAPHLPLEQRRQVLQQALGAVLPVEEYRYERWVKALAALAPHMLLEQRGQVLQQALDAALTLKDIYRLAEALAALAPQLTGSLLRQALDAVLAVEEDQYGSLAEVLAALAPQLTNSLLQQALDAMLALKEDIYRRVKDLAALAPHLPLEQRRQVLKQALDAALALKDSYPGRPEALKALAPQLTDPLLQQALDDVLILKEDTYRLAESLEALAPRLTGSLLQQALDASLALKDEPFEQQSKALEALAPRLTGSLLQQALDAALVLKEGTSYGGRATVLKALAPRLTGSLLQQALDAALALKDEYNRANVLKALAPRLTGSLLQQALDAALVLKDEQRKTPWRILYGERTEVLAALAPQLTGPLLQQALDATLTLKEDRYRSWTYTLTKLAPHLPLEQRSQILQQALDAALVQENGRDGERTDALAFLAPQLTGPLLQQALAATLALEMDSNDIPRWWSWSHAMDALARQLAGPLLQQTLDAVLTLKEGEKRERALVALIPQLTGPLLQQALTAALALEVDVWGEAHALTALAPRLTGPLIQEALNTVQSLKGWGKRAAGLTALAPQLTGPLLQQALDAALTIKEDGERASALSALAPRLTGSLCQQALDGVLMLKEDLHNHFGIRAGALRALASQLTGPLLQQTWDAALALKEDSFGSRANTLARLAPLLPLEQRNQAVQQAVEAVLAAKRGFGDGAGQLAFLVPHLPLEQGRQILQQVLTVLFNQPGGMEPTRVLPALVPQLSNPLFQQVWDAILKLEEDRPGSEDRAEALAALAPQLTGSRLQQAFTAVLAQKMDQRWHWNHVLTTLAQQLTDPFLQSTLDEVLALQEEKKRAAALVALAPQLPAPLLQQAVKAATMLEDDPLRATTLGAFFSIVPDSDALLQPIRLAMLEALAFYQEQSCRQILTNYFDQRLFKPPLFSPETLGSITSSLIEIYQEWRWL